MLIDGKEYFVREFGEGARDFKAREIVVKNSAGDVIFSSSEA